MASAGIPQDPDRPLHGLVRLADASQGSQTFATRDQARDFSTTCWPGWPTGAGSTHNSAGKPSRPWARECGNAGPPIPTTAHGHSKPPRRAYGGTCVGSAHQTTGGGVAGCLGGCSGSGGAADRQGGTTYQNDRGMTSGRETTREGREDMEKLLLTPEEAAAALGICRSKLYELLQAGVIESVHIGTSRRIPVAAMVEYIERLRQEAIA